MQGSPGRSSRLAHLIRAVVTETAGDGTAVVSERRAYGFADVGSDELSAALDPLVAEALLAGEAEVEAVTCGGRDASGGYPARFQPSQEAVGIAQALLDSSGLLPVVGCLVDERPVPLPLELPLQSRVRPCKACVHHVLRLPRVSS